MADVWISFAGSSLQQGDILEQCAIPIVRSDFDYGVTGTETEVEIDVETRRLIVTTQSCDLENGKAPYVALCPLLTLEEMRGFDQKFNDKSVCENVRRGKMEGLYMLPCPTEPEDNQQAFMVDFRMIVSLPIGYLSHHANELGERQRLLSPYVEHFSQAFARFFMRVGLPSQIPSYTSKTP